MDRGDYSVPPHPDGEDAAEWAAWIDAMPVSRALGVRCESIEEGRATFVLDDPPMRNSRGWVHGGFMLAVCDQCFGIIAMRSAPGQVRATTATLNAQFLRPAIPPVTITARVTKLGRTLTFAELEASAADDRACATAQATLTIVPRED